MYRSQQLADVFAGAMIIKQGLTTDRFWNTFQCAGGLKSEPMHKPDTTLGIQIKEELKKWGENTIAIIAGLSGRAIDSGLADYYLELACIRVLTTIGQHLPPRQYGRRMVLAA